MITVCYSMNANGLYVIPIFVLRHVRIVPPLTHDLSLNVFMSAQNLGGWTKICSSVSNILFQIFNFPIRAPRLQSWPTDPVTRPSEITISGRKNVVFIPRHTFHKIQPLDISFFAPLNQLAKKNADYIRRRPHEKESVSSPANTKNCCCCERSVNVS